MAIRLSRSSGNWTTAGTWGLVDSTSYANAESAGTLSTSYQASSGFTPGAITIEGLAVKLRSRLGTTGTMSVHLVTGGVEVAGTLVTINTSDLPPGDAFNLGGGWIFLKFAAPVTLLAATSYTVEAKTSNGGQVQLCSVSGSNWSRALVTTTTGAPAAGDDVIICGEYLSAGSSNSIAVTMDETATTDYGAASTSLVTPAVAICSHGILSYGTSSSTNYNLKVSGHVIVYCGGEFNIGTSGSEIPRDSTATLLFDCTGAADFGLTVRGNGIFTSQGLSRTSGKDIFQCLLNANASASATSLTVDTDTGWLDNDEIAIASTSRTVGDCEHGALNGNAGASSLTVDGFSGAGGGLAVAHLGTSPIQAEIILLTRNVVIRGTSVTVTSFINIGDISTIDCDWTEFKFLGTGNNGKKGIDTACTTGTQSFQYCSLRDFLAGASTGLNVTGASGTGLTFSNNSVYRVGTSAFTNAQSSGSSVIDNNVFMRSMTSGVSYIVLNDVGLTFTNNKIIGAALNGIEFREGGVPLGTFSNNSIHSCGNIGFVGNSGLSYGTFEDTTIWRCGGNGMFLGPIGEITFDGLTLFGNNTTNISCTGTLGGVTFIDLTSNGDTTFSTTNGITSSTAGTILNFDIINGDFSTVSGIKTAHTNDLNIGIAGDIKATLYNTKLAGTNEITNISNLSNYSYIASQKHDQTSGLNKVFKSNGNINTETTIVYSAGMSARMTPNSSSIKLTTLGYFEPFTVFSEAGVTVTPNVYVQQDASYNGSRARLIVKQNIPMGITSDTVLATATAASESAWELLSGTTVTLTDFGVLEFYIDCDGTNGNAYVDDFSI